MKTPYGKVEYFGSLETQYVIWVKRNTLDLYHVISRDVSLVLDHDIRTIISYPRYYLGYDEFGSRLQSMTILSHFHMFKTMKCIYFQPFSFWPNSIWQSGSQAKSFNHNNDICLISNRSNPRNDLYLIFVQTKLDSIQTHNHVLTSTLGILLDK